MNDQGGLCLDQWKLEFFAVGNRAESARKKAKSRAMRQIPQKTTEKEIRKLKAWVKPQKRKLTRFPNPAEEK